MLSYVAVPHGSLNPLNGSIGFRQDPDGRVQTLARICASQDLSRAEWAFVELSRRIRPALQTYFQRRGFPPEDAEDLAQDVQIKIAQELARYDSDRPFFPWMFTLAHHCLCDAVRRRHVETVPFQEASAEGEDPIPLVIHRWECGQVRQALRALPSHYREVLRLRFYEELELSAIADQLGLSLSAVKMRLSRGKDLLRQRLEALGVDGGGVGPTVGPKSVVRMNAQPPLCRWAQEQIRREEYPPALVEHLRTWLACVRYAAEMALLEAAIQEAFQGELEAAEPSPPEEAT